MTVKLLDAAKKVGVVCGHGLIIINMCVFFFKIFISRLWHARLIQDWLPSYRKEFKERKYMYI